MDIRTVKIATGIGSADMEVVMTQTGSGWTATLLPRPGYSFGAAASGETEEEALEKLAELAQALYDEQIEREVKLYGPPQPAQ